MGGWGWGGLGDGPLQNFNLGKGDVQIPLP